MQLVSIPDAADHYGVSPIYYHRQIKLGWIPVITAGPNSYGRIDLDDPASVPLITSGQAAQMMGISRPTLRYLLTEGVVSMPVYRANPDNPKTQRYFRKCDVEQWIIDHRSKPTNAAQLAVMMRERGKRRKFDKFEIGDLTR